MKSGIYTITAPSGGQYIGSAVCFGSRRRQHFHLLRAGKHHNPGLQRAVAKYGIESLKFEPMLVCRKEDLIFFEQRAIDIMKPRYNACPTAGSQLGRRHSEEYKARSSASRLGKSFHTPERLALQSANMKGHKFWGLRQLTPEMKRNVSVALKGKRHADGFESLATDAQKTIIVQAYQSGVGQLTLAAQWKTSHKVIRRILVAAGVESTVT
jgi:group I intron endonuclease